MRHKGRRVFALTLLAGSMLAGVAKAQEASLTTAPPVNLSVDKRGVDTTSGNFTFTLPVIAVGRPGAGGLEYHRTLIGAGWQESYVGVLRTDGGAGYTVTLGASSETFTLSGGVYTPNQGTGSTLTVSGSNYIYTTQDGSVVTFTPPLANFTGPYSGGLRRLYTIQNPNGELTTFNYETVDGCNGQPTMDPGGQPSAVRNNPDNSALAAKNQKAIAASTNPKISFLYASNSMTSSKSATTSSKSATSDSSFGDNCPDSTLYERPTSFSNNLGYEIDLNYVPGPFTSVYLPAVYIPYTITSYNNADQSNVSSWPYAQFSYPAAGTTSSITDTLGQTQTFSYDSSGHILTYQYPGASSSQFSVVYNSSGQVAAYNDTMYNYTYSYSTSGSTLTAVSAGPTGNKVYTSNTSISELTAFTDELSHTTSFAYDGYGRTMQVNRPEGDYTTYAYDGRGNLTQTISYPKPGSSLAPISVSSSFDASCANPVTCNRPNYTLDALGNQTNITYDPTHGGVTSVTSPAPTRGAAQPQTRYGYTALGAYFGGNVYRLTSTSACATAGPSGCIGGSDEIKTTLGYNANLLPNAVTSGAGDGSVSATTTVVYDGVGNPFTVDGPLPGTVDTTRFRYDTNRQLAGVVGPDPDGTGPLHNRASRITRDGRGLVTLLESGIVNSQSDSDWSGFSTLIQDQATYDLQGRKLTDAVVSSGSVQTLTQLSYNTRGLPQCVTARDPSLSGSLPASACTLTSSTAPGADRIFQSGYDAAGQNTLTLEGVGTSDSAQVFGATFGADDEQATATDANGYKTTFTYDGFNRLSVINFPDPANGANSSTAAAQTQSYLYDAASNRTQRTLRGGALQINYSYDNLNRLTYEQHPSTNGYENIAYGYDNLNRLTATTSVPYGQPNISHGWNYDALGRKTAELGPLGNSTSTYDAAGRRTQLTWPDGFYVTYDYDYTGAMTAIREYGAGAGLGVLDSFGYDELGRRISITRGNGVVTGYGYDGASRLSSLTQDLAGTSQDQSETFGYDVSSRVTSRTASNDAYAWTNAYNVDRPYSANGLNEQTVSGSNTISWSGKGTLTGDGSNTYLYNSANQIFQTGNGTNETYDGPGRLYAVGASGATRFLYDGQAVIAEYNSGGALLRRYVHGPGVDEPLVWYEGSGTGTRYGLTADRLGSITAITIDSGAATAINSYDEYGIPGASNAGRFQYTGQAYLSEFGVYNYKARNYSPTLGRFLQPDPIGYGDGMHFYNYVHSDPINNIDPSGTNAASFFHDLLNDLRNTVSPLIVTARNSVAPPPQTSTVPSSITISSSTSAGASDSTVVDELVVTAKKPQNNQPQSTACHSPATSPQELAAAMSGNRLGYWQSRAARGDPLGQTALSIVNNQGLGAYANGRLFAALSEGPDSDKGMAGIQADIQSIGVALMQQNVAYTAQVQGNVTPAGVAGYHAGIFGAFGIPASTFGGAPFTGSGAEATMTSPIWFHC